MPLLSKVTVVEVTTESNRSTSVPCGVARYASVASSRIDDAGGSQAINAEETTCARWPYVWLSILPWGVRILGACRCALLCDVFLTSPTKPDVSSVWHRESVVRWFVSITLGELGAGVGKATQPNHYNYNRFVKAVPKLAEPDHSQRRSRAANTSVNIAPEHYMCNVSAFCYSKIRQINIHYHGHANCKTRSHHTEPLPDLI